MTADASEEGGARCRRRWRFWIDVGGTFTDCVAVSPRGEVHTAKVLSTAVVKGRAGSGSTASEILDPARRVEPEDFYRGFELEILDREGRRLAATGVAASDGRRGAIVPAKPLSTLALAASYELRSPEEAPLLAVRRVLGLRLDEAVGDVEIRLGTTRGTNALLERKGPRTALVATEGFGDALVIGYQDRPRLFDLAIEKPKPLFERAVEVRERVAADGTVLVPLDLDGARTSLSALRKDGVEALAICLLHSYRNPAHEETLARLARELGFPHVVASHRSAPFEKLVPRGETALVDAYLTPLFEEYVERIGSRAPSASLRLLTSAGGLSAPETFHGRDSVLSGPAGGVVAAARAAEAAGFERAIGFDMGGTSTDVSRWDGRFEIEYEARKAGVRVFAPVLAIETVAAGGGSVCSFDGERLLVGPESAGARPGPACYGAGGPLTLTDVNLFLGRIPAERFPFPLDLRAVERRLEDLAAQLDRRGKPRSLAALAEGFVEVANARMAAAVRKVSVARGYDVRDYVLVAFGGAGGQHACALAKALGMRQVLVPALAGLLSACGAGLADVRKFAEASVLRRWEPGEERRLEDLFRELEAKARGEVLADGVGADAVEPPRRTVELRYAGQDATLAVSAACGDLRAGFEEAHRKLFGFDHPGRVLEVVAARIECVGRVGADFREIASPRPEAEVLRATRAEPASGSNRARAVFGGVEFEVEVLDAGSLPRGTRWRGPLILAAPFHTLVVEPGWEVTRSERGDCLLELAGGEARSEASAGRGAATAVDPMRLEIFHQHFAAVAEEMGEVLRRSALSTNVRERLDFSCAVFDAAGDLVANAPHIPVHLGSMGECVRHVMRALPDLGPGDAVATNDPFRGGSHLPDVTVVTPVHDASGELLFFVASRAHHAEIGGKRPGSMSPDSRSLAEEGVLIRDLRVVERGVPRLEALRRVLCSPPYSSRCPDENVADIEAQIASNRRGAELLLELVRRHGKELVQAYMGHIQDAAARLMEAAIRRLPEGRRSFVDCLDDSSPIAVTLDVRDGAATADFSGTGPVLDGNLNATPAIVSSAVLYAFRTLLGRISGDIPLNAGVLRPIRIVLPPCLLSPPASDDPSRCPAVAGGNVETSQRLVDVLLGALGVAAASQGTMNNVLFGTSRFGYYETLGGGAGAGPGFDGADAVHTHMTNTRITDVEVLERRYPVRLRRFAVRRGSGGAGAHHGGDGMVREYEFLEDVEVSLLTQRRLREPYGIEGGSPGSPGRNLLRRRGAAGWEELPPVVSFEARAGDVLRIETPGGGGWGHPR
jgi:5-oxoprolinase (ATP-hydrolysing)